MTLIYTSSVNRSVIERSLQIEFASLPKWFSSNKLLLNKKKSCSMLFGTRLGLGNSPELPISFNDGSSLKRVATFKYLGLWIDRVLCFNNSLRLL